MVEKNVETRIRQLEKQRKRETVYKPPSNLELPPELVERLDSEGYVTKWVRWLIQGKEDVTNMASRRREGYEFVSMEEAPELGTLFLKERVRGFDDAVIVGDLVLMKIEKVKNEARKKYYEDFSSRQMDALEKQLDKDTDGHSKMETRTEISRGGKRMNFVDDSDME